MAAPKSFRKSQLIAFSNVAAGHDGVLSDPLGELVVKPCKQSEIDFYESTSSHPEFAAHIPTFLGTISLGSDKTSQKAAVLVLPSETDPDPDPDPDPPAHQQGAANAVVVGNDWAPSNGERIQTDLAIVLENVADGYQKPNILDVKLGARLWADDAPAAKRVKLDKVAENSTSKPLGFRIAGMRTFQGVHTNDGEGVTSDGYKLYDKTYGRAFTTETVHQGFADYFFLAKEEKAKGPIRKVIRRFVADLEAMQKVLEQQESRMYSASLLFVYEGDEEALQEAFTIESDVIASLQARSSKKYSNRDAAEQHPKELDGCEDGAEEDGDEEEEAEKIEFPAIQSLKLIDFAHADWTPGQGPDENLLHGVRNVIKLLTDLTN